MYSDMKILITGSSGTIGTRLCEKLLEQNYLIICTDIKHNVWNNKVDGVTIIGDLRDKEMIKKLPKEIDMVIHFAANARVHDTVCDPSLARDNLEILFNILEYCRQNNIKRIVFASSREIYGNSDKILHSECDVDIEDCKSPYAASKIAGETLIYSYHQCYGIDFIITRFSNVYGMYDISDRVIPLFIKLTKSNKDLIIYGKDKLLDFTYIDDTVLGILKCIENFDQIRNDIFNISSGKGITIFEVAQLIQKNMSVNNKIIIDNNRTGEVIRFIGDISKMKNILKYEPMTDIEEGINRSINWYKENIM